MSWTIPSFRLLRRILSSEYPKMHPLSSPAYIYFICSSVSARGTSKFLISSFVLSYFLYAILYSLVTVIFLKIFIYILSLIYISLSLQVGFVEMLPAPFMYVRIFNLCPSYQKLAYSPCLIFHICCSSFFCNLVITLSVLSFLTLCFPTLSLSVLCNKFLSSWVLLAPSLSFPFESTRSASCLHCVMLMTR